MKQLKLTYFDVDGGRAEPIRLALHVGNVAFEDHRFPLSEFEQQKEKTPLGQVPVLALDGKKITQTNAILRYVGKQTLLYPQDAYLALLCDEILSAVEDCINKIVSTFFLSGDELKVARDKLVSGDLAKYLRFLESKLLANGGEFFIGQQLSVADLKVLPLINWLSSNALDHISADIVTQLAPSLAQHQQCIANDPRIVDYYSQRS